jgi:TolB-like protein/tetratricopeptide (TPR) repeat protein
LPRSSGTPIFMSPEVLAGNQATPQSDLYALGVTLLWALTGRPPFQARTLDDLKEELSRGPLSSLGSARRTSPRGLVHAIEWAIHPSAAARPRSASDLAVRLRAVLEEIDAGERRRRRSRAVLVSVAVGMAAIAFALIAIRTWVAHPLRGSPSIAVLPLANLSGDSSEDYVTDGMTEELIARFAQIGDLRVISRSSVMPFKNSKESLPEIAKKLRVRMVVEGTVLRVRDSLRISARLVDAGSGRAVWASMYDGDWNNVLALQSNVAKAVVGHVRARVTPRERARLESAPEVNPEAYRLYLQGLAAYRLLSPDGIRRAIISFGKATEIDPTYAAPWVGLAYAYDFAVAVGLLSERESADQSLAAARRAVALDPESGPARSALASTQLDHDWDFKAAELGYRQALALSPGNSDARGEFVTLLCMLGRFDEAIQEAKRARDADPVSLAAGAVSMFPLYEAKRYDECISVGRDLLALHPDASWVLLIVGQAQFLAGRHEEGIRTIEKSIALDRTPPGIGWLGYAYGRAGKPQRARAVLTELNQMQRKFYVDPYYLGITHLGLGEKSAALDYIEQAGRSHSPEAKLLRVDPFLDPLRSEPRFRALLKRLDMLD